ncbi:myosin-9-like [Neltuma alba]|uniref:myosin-9-like n=1 Tax=Neltuma alba TaxID=207710 RepID=UPI0010A4F0BB|nr:myosin-9-like [Prosopis alba]XP_028783043.1 myosin-9-like [Prosopis alba]
MAAVGDGDADAVLSDVEDDDNPVPITIRSPAPEDVSADRVRELLVELDRERQARQTAENSKSELQVSFNRLKALAHEAIKKRDEFGRQRDEALLEIEDAKNSKDKLLMELAEANRVKNELSIQRDEIAKQFDELVKERDALRSEIGNSTQMLVNGMDKISAKVSIFKNFAGNGLARSQKYTGLAAVAYGVIMRANEIVEELVKQIESTAKSRNKTREQMEQRNYEIAIEVSQLEATISQLREEVTEKTSIVENLERTLAEKDEKVNEAVELKQIVIDYDDKLSKLETTMELQRTLLIDQLSSVSKIHNQTYHVIKIIDANHSEVSESLFLPQVTDNDGLIRASLAGMESIYELIRIVAEKAKDVFENKNNEIRTLEDTATRLVREKDQIGSLLRSALSKRITSDPSSRKNELFLAAENGLREAGIDFKFSKLLGDGRDAASNDKANVTEKEEDDICSLAAALENVVKASQLEIIDLQHARDELRTELSLLKQHVEDQAKELNLRMQRIEELEEKEKVANESVEGLMIDIASAEEEINRWKVAAEQEAGAGRAVEQEFATQLSAVKQELEEAKQSMLESEKKLKFKEETTTAAMAARDAAEKSLRLADLRASRLRERVEELTRQLEEFESREDSRSRSRPRYVCWPWQWLGMDFVGPHRPDAQQLQASNEMELSEPFL